jgi:hypothetical protein
MLDAIKKDLAPIIKARAEKLRQEIEAYEAAEAEVGLPALRARENATHDAWVALVDQIIMTPAQSVAGIATKLAITRNDTGWVWDTMIERLTRSACDDAERLAGGAA